MEEVMGICDAEFINENEGKEEAPQIFSAVVNNDDILQMYLKDIGKKRILTK